MIKLRLQCSANLRVLILHKRLRETRMKYFDEGYQTFRNGYAIYCNPYDRDTVEYYEWIRGYKSATRDRMRMGPIWFALKLLVE